MRFLRKFWGWFVVLAVGIIGWMIGQSLGFEFGPRTEEGRAEIQFGIFAAGIAMAIASPFIAWVLMRNAKKRKLAAIADIVEQVHRRMLDRYSSSASSSANQQSWDGEGLSTLAAFKESMAQVGDEKDLKRREELLDAVVERGREHLRALYLFAIREMEAEVVGQTPQQGSSPGSISDHESAGAKLLHQCAIATEILLESTPRPGSFPLPVGIALAKAKKPCKEASKYSIELGLKSVAGSVDFAELISDTDQLYEAATELRMVRGMTSD